MKGSHLSSKAYAELLNLMNRQYFCERVGKPNDYSFLQADQWLKDSAVIDQVIRTKEGWAIYLIFAHAVFPYRFIRRFIHRINHPKKATVTAEYMRRQAAKDQRGTLTIQMSDFSLCTN